MDKLIFTITIQRGILNLLLSRAFYIFSMVVLALFQSCSSTSKTVANEQQAESWKMVKQAKSQKSPDWTIYAHRKAGSKFKEFKIVGTINVTPEKAVQALWEKTEHSEKYLTEKDGSIKVLSKSEKEALVYSVYNLPFPFKDREMCERFLFFVDQETGIHKISWQEDWELAPAPKKNAVRMPVARGSWEFIPIEAGRSSATYIVHAEPGGSIPAWMVNAAVSKGLPAELESIEKIAEKLQ